MQIGFDAKRLFLNQTGLGNYSRFIVDSLLKHYPNEQLVLFSPKTRKNKQTEHYFTAKNVEIVNPKGFLSWPFFQSIWRSFFIGKEAQAQDLDVYHGLSHELPKGLPNHVKQVLTVHDVIFLRHPELFNPLDVWIYKQKLKSACRQADKIVAISQQTKNDLMAFFNVSEEKIHVIYQGCHQQFLVKKSEEEREHVRKKYKLPKGYLLNVGSIEKRKNVGILLEALATFDATERPHLVLVGKKTSYMDELERLIQKHHLQEFVHFIHQADFADLPAIYQQATLFTYSSVIEGFGIPILEAMVSEVPVLVPNVSCFDEVVGPAGIFYQQGDIEDLRDKIKTLLKSDNRAMIANQLAYAQRFFEDVVKKLYEEVYS